MGISGLQLMITVVVMLSVAGLALLVDFLRARNLQLQQTVSELRGQNEIQHAQRALEPLMKQSAASALAATAIATPAQAPAEHGPVMQTPDRAEKEIVRKAVPTPHAQRPHHDTHVRKPLAASGRNDAFTKDELQKTRDAAAELTSRTGRRRPSSPAGAPLPSVNGLSSKATLEEWLSRRAAERAARNAKTVETPAVETPKESVEPATADVAETPAAEVDPQVVVEHAETAPVVDSPVVESIAEPVVIDFAPVAEEALIEVTPDIVAVEEPEEVAIATYRPLADARGSETVPEIHEPVEIHEREEAVVEASPAPSGLPPVQIDAALWKALFGTELEEEAAPESVETIQPVPSAEPEVIFEVIRGAASLGLVVPSGLHDKAELARLLSMPKPFTGLVVSIGVDSQDGDSELSEDLLRSIEAHIAGLLREKDFGCRGENDEFLMICPGDDAAEAQRRLSQLSERLWDYQLRSIGRFSMLFSSGGIHVRNESLSDAFASAEERMNQTRRSRKSAIVNSMTLRRQAV